MEFYREANGVFTPTRENEIQFIFILLWKIGTLAIRSQPVKNSIFKQRAFFWISQNAGETISMLIGQKNNSPESMLSMK